MTSPPSSPSYRPPPIADYAVVGDCRTAALVSREGSVDWMCLPRIDGRSVFGALLDGERGGRCSVGARDTQSIRRAYLPGSNVLETHHETATGTLRVVDLMPVNGPQEMSQRLVPDHELLRRVECTSGEVHVHALCDPRFDYGRHVPTFRRVGARAFCCGHRGDALALCSDLPFAPCPDGPGLVADVRLGAGEVRWISLTTETGGPLLFEALGDEAERRFQRTRAWWQEWLQECTYQGPYAAEVRRSALVLKLLAYPPSGAILAAATTSLPEWPGGERNWDYRYCWLRDASFTLRVLLDIGFSAEGEAFLAWLLHATRLTRPAVDVLYDVYGRTHHGEEILEHLSGYRDSRPVRIGNAAADQFQLDVYGSVVAAAFEFVDGGGELPSAEAALIAGMGRTVQRRWREPDDGIWETRADRRHYVHSKVMCWVALDRLAKLHERGVLEAKPDLATVLRERDAIAGWVEEHGVDPSTGAYVAWPGTEHTDAALLLAGIYGFTDPAGERMEATHRHIRRELGQRELVLRYRYGDGVAGEEAAFGICSFWEVRLLALQDRVGEARQRFEEIMAYGSDLGLFAEEIDVENRRLLGNFPQAYTHVGLIGAAVEIADAEARAEGRSSGHTRSAPRQRAAEAEKQ